MFGRCTLSEESRRKLAQKASSSVRIPKAQNVRKISIKSVPKFKMPKKDLTEHKRLPAYIRCGNETARNYEKPSVKSYNLPMVESFSDHLYEALLDKIRTFAKNRIVLGCVAWFTDDGIVEALSKARKVLIIVNDEPYKTWGNGVVTPNKYRPLPAFGDNPPLSYYWKNVFDTTLNFKGLEGKHWEAVRCYGYNCVVEKKAEEAGLSPEETKRFTEKRTMMNSIMHAKTLVICDDNNIPRWVWSGSINFTKNARNNIEEGYFFDDKIIAANKFHMIANVFWSSGSLRY